MNQNDFLTFDLNLSSALIALGYELLELDKSNPKKVCFGFKREKNIEQAMDDYFNDKIKLPAQMLFNNQKNLKNRIYSDS